MCMKALIYVLVGMCVCKRVCTHARVCVCVCVCVCYLWCVLLELAALVDEYFSGLFALILSVGQLCGGGVKFPLKTHTHTHTHTFIYVAKVTIL